MSKVGIKTANRPAPDKELADIADFVCDYQVDSDEAFSTARYCLMDSLACSGTPPKKRGQTAPFLQT